MILTTPASFNISPSFMYLGLNKVCCLDYLVDDYFIDALVLYWVLN